MNKLPKFIQSAKTTTSLLALVFLAGCASVRSTASNRLDQQVAHADIAYRRLHTHGRAAYNNAVASIALAFILGCVHWRERAAQVRWDAR